MPAELPGFYFDPAKGKYFRITSDRIAPAHSAAAKYSASSVARLTAAELAASRRAQNAIQRKQETIQHAKVLRHPVTACLRRETDGNVTEYTHGFGTSDFTLLEAQRTTQQGNKEKPRSRITAIARHGSSIFAGLASGETWRFDERTTSWHRFWSLTGCEVQSLLVNRTLSDLFAVQRDGMIIRLGAIRTTDGSWTYNSSQLWSIEQTFRSAAMCPDAAVDKIAIATDPPLCLDVATGTSTDICHVASNVLDVQWQNPNVLALGRRDGAVNLADIRAEGSVMRFRHPSAACKIRYVDTSTARILVAGLENRLSLYDLRFCKSNGSTPWLQYAGYQNQAMPELGFDVEPGLGLIAAAADSGGVKIIDLWKGNEVRSKGDMRECGDGGVVSTITFDHEYQERNGDCGVGYCLVGSNKKLQRWIWGKAPNEDPTV